MSSPFEETQDSVIVSFVTAQILGESKVLETGDNLNDACRRAVTTGKRLVLDFHGDPCINSAMLGKLVLLNKFAKMNNVILRLVNVSKNVMEVFRITRLNKVFQFGDRDDGPDFLGSPVPRPRRPSGDSGHGDPRVS